MFSFSFFLSLVIMRIILKSLIVSHNSNKPKKVPKVAKEEFTYKLYRFHLYHPFLNILAKKPACFILATCASASAAFCSISASFFSASSALIRS